MTLKIHTEQVIDDSDWNKLVTETYKRPYCYQQQNGCQDRGTYKFKVPNEGDDFKNDTVPEIINDPEMGVSFKAWLERDPHKPIQEQKYDWELQMWWERNFYPDIQMVANDLHKKGILPAGEYTINIDW